MRTRRVGWQAGTRDTAASELEEEEYQGLGFRVWGLGPGTQQNEPFGVPMIAAYSLVLGYCAQNRPMKNTCRRMHCTRETTGNLVSVNPA